MAKKKKDKAFEESVLALEIHQHSERYEALDKLWDTLEDLDIDAYAWEAIEEALKKGEVSSIEDLKTVISNQLSVMCTEAAKMYKEYQRVVSLPPKKLRKVKKKLTLEEQLNLL